MSSQITTTNDELRLVTQTSSTAILPSQPYQFLSVSGFIDFTGGGGFEVNPGDQDTFDISLPGASLGDLVVCVSSVDLAGLVATAYVSAANQASVSVRNDTVSLVTIQRLTVYLMRI